MKKILIIIMSCLMLIGCHKELKYDNVDNIYFITGSNSYEIISDKHQEILDYLNNIDMIQHESIDEIDKFWSIKIDDQMIYLNEDGSFIIDGSKYTPEDTTLIDMYKDALGSDIFIGAIWCSKDWVVDAENVKQIFSININKVQQVTFVPDYKIDYKLKEEKLDLFINALNNTTSFPYKEYMGRLFGKGIHNIYVEYGNSKYHFHLIDDGNIAYILTVVKDYAEDEHGWCLIFLDSSTLGDVYKEIFGERFAYILDDGTELEINNEWIIPLE